MTRYEAINILLIHSAHWTRLIEEKICGMKEGKEAVQAIDMAITALEQEPCDDCISREEVLAKKVYTETEEGWSGFTVDAKYIENLPPVTPAEKVGRWILVQRGKYVDINCSECGYRRIESFAFNFTVADINEQEFKDFVKNNKMYFCECCGGKMEVEE